MISHGLVLITKAVYCGPEIADVSTGNYMDKWNFFWLKVCSNPVNMLVYLRDGSAQTILRAATLR